MNTDSKPGSTFDPLVTKGWPSGKGKGNKVEGRGGEGTGEVGGVRGTGRSCAFVK